MRAIHRLWSINPRNLLSYGKWQASVGISGKRGKHLRALIEEAGLIIAIGGAVDWRSRVQKPTDQSRPKPLILCCESDEISENLVLSFFVSEENNRFRGAPGLVMLRRSSGFG